MKEAAMAARIFDRRQEGLRTRWQAWKATGKNMQDLLDATGLSGAEREKFHKQFENCLHVKNRRLRPDIALILLKALPSDNSEPLTLQDLLFEYDPTDGARWDTVGGVSENGAIAFVPPKGTELLEKIRDGLRTALGDTPIGRIGEVLRPDHVESKIDLQFRIALAKRGAPMNVGDTEPALTLDERREIAKCLSCSVELLCPELPPPPHPASGTDADAQQPQTRRGRSHSASGRRSAGRSRKKMSKTESARAANDARWKQFRERKRAEAETAAKQHNDAAVSPPFTALGRTTVGIQIGNAIVWRNAEVHKATSSAAYHLEIPATEGEMVEILLARHPAHE